MRRLGLAPLLAIGAIIGYGPLFVLSVLSIQIGTDSIRGQVDHRLTSSATLSSRFIAAHMQDVLDTTSSFARNADVVSALGRAVSSPESVALIRAQLAQLQTSIPDDKVAFIADPSGTLTDLQPSDPAVLGVNFSNRDWYRGVTLSRTPYISEAYVSSYTGNPLVVAVVAPVLDDSAAHNLLAIIGVTYPLFAIQAFTEQFSSANQLSLTVIDQHGHVVAGPGIRSGSLTSPATDSRVQSALVGRSGLQEVSANGRQILSAYAPISELGWALISQVNKDQALADAARLTASVLSLTGLLSLLLAAGIGVLAMNLAKRREAETRLREQAEQSFQLLDGLPVGIFVVGGDGRPKYANKLSAELLGQGVRPDAELSETSEVYRIYTAGTDELYPTDQLPVARALAGEHIVVDDLEIERGNGRIAVEAWTNAIRDGEGKVTAAVAAFLDVTERKQAQRDLAGLNAELETRVLVRTAELAASNQGLAASNEELEAFTYTVSHDLRAPLRGMAGFAARLKEQTAEMADPELGRFADRIIANAQRMGLLIDHLLMLSKLNRQQLRVETVSPGAVAQRALDDLDGAVRGSHVKVVIDAMADCESDPKLLQQVYANLIGNALKYSSHSDHATVEVGSTTDPRLGTVYHVRDNGAGFDARYKHKLFGVFQRLHNDTEFEGTGVGLAIVQRIVTRHGGEVFAESVLGEGATFSFTLGGHNGTVR